MSEPAHSNDVVSPACVGTLKSQAIALAIVIPILYLPFMWLAFDFELSPYSGMLVFSQAFAICSLVRLPLLGLVVGIGFLTLSHIAVSFSLARSKIWLISTCLVLAAISTESSREIYQKTKTVVGDGWRCAAVEGTIIKNIVFGSESSR